MRLDYIFYIIAAAFLVITAIALSVVADQNQRSLWMISTVVLGLFSAGLGYHLRPRTETHTAQTIHRAQETMPKPRQSAVEDSHELEALSTENIKRTSEYSIFPPSPNPMPSQVIAPIPVLTLSPIETPKVASSELKLVRGIGDKRAEQLKGFGISNIDDLAHASASDIATKLMTSPKIVEKWIARARELSE